MYYINPALATSCLCFLEWTLSLGQQQEYHIKYDMGDDAGVTLLLSPLETKTASLEQALQTHPMCPWPIQGHIPMPGPPFGQGNRMTISIERIIPWRLKRTAAMSWQSEGVGRSQQGASCSESHGKLNLSSDYYFKDSLVPLSGLWGPLAVGS